MDGCPREWRDFKRELCGRGLERGLEVESGRSWAKGGDQARMWGEAHTSFNQGHSDCI